MIEDIITLLKGLVNSDSNKIFVDVLDNSKNEFSGFPSARVLPGPIKSKIIAQGANELEKEAMIDIYLPISQGFPEQTAWDKMVELQEATRKALDKSKDLTNSVMILLPAETSEPEEEVIGGGSFLVGEVSVVAKIIE